MVLFFQYRGSKSGSVGFENEKRVVELSVPHISFVFVLPLYSLVGSNPIFFLVI